MVDAARCGKRLRLGAAFEGSMASCKGAEVELELIFSFLTVGKCMCKVCVNVRKMAVAFL